jgi:hypothetical protein
VHVDDVVIAEPLPAPDPFEQPLAAERDPRLTREHVEQIELELRQLDELAAASYLSRRRVDLQIPEAAHPARAAGSRPSQHCPHPSHQLTRRERLCDVIVGSGREPDDPVDLLDPRGEHHDVRVAESSDLPARFDPVDPGQHQIEHDHIRVKLPR